MKKNLVLFAALLCLSTAYSQKRKKGSEPPVSDTVVVQNHSFYTGKVVTIGKGSGDGNTFMYVTVVPQTGLYHGLTTGQNIVPCPTQFIHSSVTVTRVIKEPHKTTLKCSLNQTPKPYQYAGKESFVINLELAAESKEILMD